MRLRNGVISGLVLVLFVVNISRVEAGVSWDRLLTDEIFSHSERNRITYAGTSDPLPPLQEVTLTDAGSYHTCALTSGGGLKCWGYNGIGQLGDGSQTDRNSPVDVSDLSSGVVAFTAGRFHTCAITSDGGLKCWGDNWRGQLGDGTDSRRLIPVDVVGLSSGIVATAAGNDHTCALTASGGVKCWGYNINGQLGNGTTQDSSTPVDVTGLSNGVAAIAAGADHTCALTDSGGMVCWGRNDAGQLGIGTWDDSSIPVGVAGLASGVAAIDLGGYHTCALMTGGGVKCWGTNDYGELGNGTSGWITEWKNTPVDVTGLSSGVASISAGLYFTCAILANGGIQCWGHNHRGQLGDGTLDDRTLAVDVIGASDGMAAVTGGGEHACALMDSGEVICWGNNWEFELGDGRTTRSESPVDVFDLTSGVAAVGTGWDYSCALTTGGGVECWGNNGAGQLGDGTYIPRGITASVSYLTSGVEAIALGGWHACALMSSGGVKCWGFNNRYQLGTNMGSDSQIPLDVEELTSGVISLDAGGEHSCAVTTNGGAKCWGSNSQGQLGGVPVFPLLVADVTGLSNGVASISAGGEHTCALTTGEGVKCWGKNEQGQLGIGVWSGYSVDPVDVDGLTSDVIAISTGAYHTCAITSSGGVKCWGENGSGQAGDGTYENKNSPVEVVGLSSGVVAIAAGGYHTCALTTDNAVKCWGYQYGNTPQDISGLSGGIASIDAFWNHTCAMTTSGGLKCWGEDIYGQLGQGNYILRTSPVNVVASVVVEPPPPVDPPPVDPPPVNPPVYQFNYLPLLVKGP